jgi:predicted RNA methylase
MNQKELFLDYERISHHKSMMSDSVRINAYQKAINECISIGDIVVDFGAGTGILSLLAAKSGAEKIYAIERTDIIHVAQKIAEDNKINNIVFINADSADVVLPEKCDVLLSECLGYMAIQENMISDFLNFREKYLKPNGVVIPMNARLFFAPIANKQVYENIEFWDSVTDKYGFDYKCLREVSANSTYHVNLQKKDYLATPFEAFKINLAKDNGVNLKCKIEFKIERQDIMHGVSGYFTSMLSPNVELSTSPLHQTHWKQYFYPLSKPLLVNSGDIVKFNVEAILFKSMVDWIWKISVNDIDEEEHHTRNGIRLKELTPEK